MVKTTELPIAEYMESTLTDIKNVITDMPGSEDDKKHLLDTLWMLTQSAKDGNAWTVDFGFTNPPKEDNMTESEYMNIVADTDAIVAALKSGKDFVMVLPTKKVCEYSVVVRKNGSNAEVLMFDCSTIPDFDPDTCEKFEVKSYLEESEFNHDDVAAAIDVIDEAICHYMELDE